MITLAIQEPEERPAANSPDYLLDLSRKCGLREAMHGVPPAKARELLSAFVGLLDAERTVEPSGMRELLDDIARWKSITSLPRKCEEFGTLAAFDEWNAELWKRFAAARQPDEPMTEPFMVTGTRSPLPAFSDRALSGILRAVKGDSACQ